ncbi:S-adenosyl-L-methionine-dependent methyltransferase [Mucor lusitanicus]|uniref:Methyltransferase type 11 domain-containing protein n=2 Tax=Mucor circinelloides f. lusitanicus TaxID=29924 RepID=A0A168NMZ7_MUCCL|nr:S-adenosyl-L-methionine-dependent methyltransferase [Mucor lusitanicus]OAD06501.1 hypothetical protein MUCCIDRAFT_90667 [Mucor lusitanicus CBS 277.49]
MISQATQSAVRQCSSLSNTGKSIHAVASKGFNLQTDAYAQTRPSYPEALLNKVQEILPEKASVIDLAAGTGLMTKALVGKGFNVTAVEPVEGMRAKLVQVVPDVPCIEGTSWNIPVENESQDAIVVAQAFHWFDDVKTLQEMHRVLKPGGYGILAWNLESGDRSEWVAKLRNCYEAYDSAVPQFRKMKWRQIFDTEEAKSLFALPYASELFKHDYLVPKQDIWRRVLSKSYIASLDAPQQEALKVQVDAILEDVPTNDQHQVFYPHDTYLIYFAKK